MNNHVVMCRYCISQNPEVEAKLVAELDMTELLVTEERPHPQQLEYRDYADSSRLPYLHCVMKVTCPVPAI